MKITQTSLNNFFLFLFNWRTHFKFSINDINKLILLLQKGVYPYEYMDDWEKFNETTLPGKEEIYSNLNTEEITECTLLFIIYSTDYYLQIVIYSYRLLWYSKIFCEDFEIKNLGEYHDLYLKSDTLLLADVLENCRKMCPKIYELDPSKFHSAPRLAWQAALKKEEVKLELLTDIDMLLMV